MNDQIKNYFKNLINQGKPEEEDKQMEPNPNSKYDILEEQK